MFCWTQRSAIQYQVNMHSTATATSSRKGVKIWRKDSGSVLIPVKAYLAFGIKDTDVDLFGMKIDSTVVFVLLDVKSHMASSFGLKCFLSKRHFNMPQEEALNIIKELHLTAIPLRLIAAGELYG